MYKLYNVKAWGSMGVHFLLEEMDVPYTNIWMTPEQVTAPEFRELSPLGYIPALGLDDGARCLNRRPSFLPGDGASRKGDGAAARIERIRRVPVLAAFHEHQSLCGDQHGRPDNFYSRNATEELPRRKVDRKMRPALGHPGQAPGDRRAMADGREIFGARHLCLHAVLLGQAKGNNSSMRNSRPSQNWRRRCGRGQSSRRRWKPMG